MLANNETGAIQPVGRAGGPGAPSGASRSTPTPCRPSAGSRSTSTRWASTTLAASATSSTGRWGSGCSWSASGVRLGSRLFGGGQQQGRRPGTVAVPLAVGLAAALRTLAGRGRRRGRPAGPRSATGWSGPDRRAGARAGSSATARPTTRRRLPQTLNLGFPGLDGDALLMQLDLAGVAASLGSACASGSTRPSPTLVAMRVPDDRLRSSVRFSLGADDHRGRDRRGHRAGSPRSSGGSPQADRG